MSELKNCPFCNEPARLCENRGIVLFVTCPNEDCCGYRVYTSINDWNIRPIEDQLRVENERLLKIIASWKIEESCWIKRFDDLKQLNAELVEVLKWLSLRVRFESRNPQTVTERSNEMYTLIKQALAKVKNNEL